MTSEITAGVSLDTAGPSVIKVPNWAKDTEFDTKVAPGASKFRESGLDVVVYKGDSHEHMAADYGQIIDRARSSNGPCAA